ncbi:MAG: sigma-E processing peptidase SpoIIGA [Clostridia bacterium]|nr:sigma-E processing peptidase SpoIIGA [Clostridia bacterium]
MTQIVYADVLFVINMLITYLLIRLVAVIFSARKSVIRMVIASAVGGIFSFYILAPEQHFLLTMFIKLSFSAVIIFAAFKISSARQFVRLMLCFYAVSFAFAGIMMAAWILLEPQGVLINNSTVYFDISVPLLLVSCAFCYALIWLIQRAVSKRVPRSSLCDVSVVMGERIVTCRAMIDTGNSLCDLFTGFPVIIARYASVERLIPYEYRAFYLRRGELPQSVDGFSRRVRTIPYEAVGGGGILPSFRPDYIMLSVNSQKIRVDNVIIAIASDSMEHTDYDVLLNSSMSEYY